MNNEYALMQKRNKRILLQDTDMADWYEHYDS